MTAHLTKGVSEKWHLVLPQRNIVPFHQPRLPQPIAGPTQRKAEWETHLAEGILSERGLSVVLNGSEGHFQSSSFTITNGLEDSLCLSCFSPVTAKPYQLSTSLPCGSEEVQTPEQGAQPKAETQMNTTQNGFTPQPIPQRAAPQAVRRPSKEGRRQGRRRAQRRRDQLWSQDGAGFPPKFCE